MNQVDVFLASIHAEPESDDQPLIFADWLDDHGDARGELIRLQVRRARLPARTPEWFALERREQELLDRHAVGWLGPLYRPAISWEYVRGLLHVEVEAEAFLTEPVETEEDRRAFAWVERLTFRGLTRSMTVALAHFPHLVHLRTLDLGENSIGTEGIIELTTTQFLLPVRTLDLRGCRVGGEGTAAFGAVSSQAHQLTRLVLWDNQIGNGGTARLVASSSLAHLAELDLAQNNITDRGAQALADSPHLVTLRLLDLRSNRIGDTGAEALAASPHLAGLRRLDLLNNEISEKGVGVLQNVFGNRVAVNVPRSRSGGGYL